MDPDSASEDDPGELLRRWQEERDSEALDQLLRIELATLASKLRMKAGPRLGASVSASDLVQDAVVRMLRQKEPPEFEHPNQLKAYLWTSAWRLFLNRAGPDHPVRRLSEVESREFGEGLQAPSQNGAEEYDQNLALQLTVNLLKDEDRQILDLTYFKHQELELTAGQLGLSRAAAEMRLTRARRRLAEKLCDWSELIQ